MPKRVHILGIAGTLMGAFASYLQRTGVRVTGTDQNIYPPMSDVLSQAGVEFFSGYSPSNLDRLSPAPDLVVVGNVIPAVNPEIQEVLKRKWNYCSLPEYMERYLLKNTRNLVVAGTHGKTTTSSLLAFVLTDLGKNPSYFIGGVSPDLPHSFQVQNHGEHFVLEGDEYDTAFWDKVPKFNHYLPNDVILTSVEYDHADIYPDLEAVVRAFEGLIQRIRSGGRLIACADYENVRRCLRDAKVPVTTYGMSGGPAEYQVGAIQVEDELMRFEVLHRGKKCEELKVTLVGAHNALNALAVWLECRELGIENTEIKKSLQRFQGVKRRMEVRGEKRGILVVDDFAHHPTAVRETLRAVKAKYPGRRVIAVFEPRSATSRRKIFQKDYAEAFGSAEMVLIASPNDTSKIAAENQFSSEQLIADLRNKNQKAWVLKEADQGVSQVGELAQAGDVVAVLSNGGFGGFIGKLLAIL